MMPLLNMVSSKPSLGAWACRGRSWLRGIVLFAGWLVCLAGGAFASEVLHSNDKLSQPQPAGVGRDFWSFQPVRRVDPPDVNGAAWAATPIDRFVLSRLEKNKLSPAPPATKRELIRRVFFDLIGLPPSLEEVETFERDASPQAYEKLIDRLLADPRYGERWGQHWLDVVRFAETEGFEYDRNIPDAWRYRDYVIQSFNADKPFDQFVHEQLAGDEFDPPSREAQIAAGFHRLGAVRRNAGNQDVTSSRNEILTERTDILGAAFLGLTMGCARCHDHKFDPILQKDYYQLQAYLCGTEENDIPLGSAGEHAAWKSKTEAVNDEIKKLREELKGKKGDEEKRIRAKIEKTEASLPAPLPTIASIKNSESNRTAIHVLRRGDWEKKGEPVGMRGPAVLVGDSAPELPPETAKPKTALAEWLTEPEHPLTARVMVNRIWQHHFGQGLVSTPNDFGVNGARPSHPELLDWLAGEFVSGGWRMKPLHRAILLSSAYRQSSLNPAAAKAREIDPANRLLWSFPRRRLGAEALRDAMLAVSGQLNPKAGGPSVIIPVDQELVNQLYKPSQWAVTPDTGEHHRRSIYLLAKRNLRLPFMETFDAPALQTSCARRESSTHAPQALELLNGRLANETAAAFAERLQREAGPKPRKQIERAFQLACGRPPTPAELKTTHEFLEHQPLKEFALAMFNLNAFLYVD